jgi:hypothetical protein
MRIAKRWFPRLLIALLLLSSYGCRTTGTAAHATGEAVSDTAGAVGHAVGVAAEGAGDIVEKTANEADDELD